MACAANCSGFHPSRFEDSAESEVISIEPTQSPMDPPAPVDLRDPEGFLKRCSGFCKKTKLRCSAVIGKKAQQNTHPAFLPTCGAHREQQSFAGWCQFKRPDGERCARLFRWSPPYFELCVEHQGHPDTPCHFINQLPLEIRHEIYRYLLPTKPISSSTAAVHQPQDKPIAPFAHLNSGSGQRFIPINNHNHAPPPPLMAPLETLFPMPLLNLLLVSRQIYHEVKDFLFSIATFKIDVRKDGAFMCGRRLLEPKRADGSSHFLADEADNAKKRFLKTFDWSAVKNYTVDILLENCENPHFINHIGRTSMPAWDEEVEIYDIRDYVGVVVSGILAKSKNLCKLQVRVCLADFQWEQDQILANARLLVSPFERLRNVRQASLGGVFEGKPDNNSMYSVARGGVNIVDAQPGSYAICSVPSIPINNLVLAPGIPPLNTYAAHWRRWISATGSTPMTEDPQIRRMFTEFKDFYTHLSGIVREVTYRNGRHTFLHRARVAREQEDVIAFREIRSELIQYWEMYLAREEQKKKDMDQRLGNLLSSDSYPSHEWEAMSPKQHKSPSGQSIQSPVLLDADTMARDGIPMTGNPGKPRNFQGALGLPPPSPGPMRPLPPNNIPSQAALQQRMQARLQQQQQLQQQSGMLAQPVMNQQANVQSLHSSHSFQMYKRAQEQVLQQRKDFHTLQLGLRQHAVARYNQRAQHIIAQQATHTIKQEPNNDDIYSDLSPFHEDAGSINCIFPDFLAHSHPLDPTIPSSPPVTIFGSASVPTTRIPLPSAQGVGEPGPSSTKRRRIDSGFEEGLAMYADEEPRQTDWDTHDSGMSYIGKGKGKMSIKKEVITLD